MSADTKQIGAGIEPAKKPDQGPKLIDLAIRYGFLTLLLGLVVFFSIFAEGFAGPRSAVFIF